jgi:hypothetical protein
MHPASVDSTNCKKIGLGEKFQGEIANDTYIYPVSPQVSASKKTITRWSRPSAIQKPCCIFFRLNATSSSLKAGEKAVRH